MHLIQLEYSVEEYFSMVICFLKYVGGDIGNATDVVIFIRRQRGAFDRCC